MDGLGGLDPVRAFCRKGRTPEETITQINTTISFDTNVINPTGKKIIPVTYLADEESLRELLLHFKNCRQYIRYRCARSALFKSPTGPKKVCILLFILLFGYINFYFPFIAVSKLLLLAFLLNCLVTQ